MNDLCGRSFDWHIAGCCIVEWWTSGIYEAITWKLIESSTGYWRPHRAEEQSLPTSFTELIHRGRDWHCKTTSLCRFKYLQHIYQLPIYHLLYSLLALCKNSVSNSAELILNVSGLAVLGTNVIPTPTSQPAFLHNSTVLRSSLGIWFFICWWICKSLYSLAQSSFFYFYCSSHFAPTLFSRCAAREKGQPHPCTEWHSMRRRKGEVKSCLVLPLMSKSMHLSLKGWREWKRGRSFWDFDD